MDNVMTINQYTDKMFSIIETALYNYEVNALVEAADDPEAAETNKPSKFANAMKVVGAAIKKVWDAIINAFKWLIDKIKNVVNKPITLDADVEVYKGALRANTTLGMYAKELLNGRIDCVKNGKLAEELEKALEKELCRAGQTINTREIMAVCKKYVAMASQLRNIGFKGNEEDVNEANRAVKQIADAYTKYAADCRKLCQKIVDIKQTDDDKLAGKIAGRDKAAKKEEKRQLKMKPMTDDASSADDITLAAQLIMEAAQLLSEGAEDYVDGIEGGEGTQKDIEDIPEEKPVVDDEYPADAVTGGAGEPIDQEEVKDLVDGDKEAIDILNDDEGSKTVTESVILRF